MFGSVFQEQDALVAILVGVLYLVCHVYISNHDLHLYWLENLPGSMFR